MTKTGTRKAVKPNTQPEEGGINGLNKTNKLMAEKSIFEAK
jgi:hypothetical protein